jgi:hypothetical protein
MVETPRLQAKQDFKPLAFRRSKILIVAERLVIPANEPESRKKAYIEASGCRIKSGMT